jgi:tRNA G18 (ribose-2'-O)-methylase SpoU
MDKLIARPLRKSQPTPEDLAKIKRNPIYLILDEVMDTYNIGSLFRLADAVSAEKIYLTGNMEYPPSSRIHTAAIGTENWVPWEKTDSAVETARILSARGIMLIAVEQDPRSIDYSLLSSALRFPVAIIVGHETQGIKKEVLDIADIIVELPMLGINKSFNVWGSAAVIAYKILESLK